MSSASVLDPAPTANVPSRSQRAAIEADPGPLLVLAGPGAGKTYCLAERIRFLIERHAFDAARICAFTFTNKAAGEIAHRLEAVLGPSSQAITRGTIHAFCADLLRKHAAVVGLEPGFGIADEDYQLGVLRRIEGPRRWHRKTLTRFSAHRFRDDPLQHDDHALFASYEEYLASRHVVDFDTLIIKAVALLETSDVAPEIRARWDVVLVDEFQDLNPMQYRVVKALAHTHRHVFAVGDDEQSIYSWAGADPKVFLSFSNDFSLAARTHLEENRRCPRDVFALARRLVSFNPALFADRIEPLADRDSSFPVQAIDFASEREEAAWIIDDVRTDRLRHGHAWGDVALLYRTHEIGQQLETAFLTAGIPCRLAQGRALAEDPVIAYVIAAMRVIVAPHDDVARDAFFGVVLPRPLFDEVRAQAAAKRRDVKRELSAMASTLPKADENARLVRRGLADWRNLAALGKRHAKLPALVQELLSRRVGAVRSVLDDRHDEISDPASLPDVVRLAERLRAARDAHRTVSLARMGGVELALKSILATIGLTVTRGDDAPPDSVHITFDDVPSVGIALGVFKAVQLIEMTDASAAFTSFTAVDLETTGKLTKTAEIVEIAAVRVREGRVVDHYVSLVKPRGTIEPGASQAHHITEADVAEAPSIEAVWPAFRTFCGDDVLVAHNGYSFDFPILARVAKSLGVPFDITMYDTLPLARDLYPTSRKLENLAKRFGIPTGQSHRALDDTLALAKVVLALDDAKLTRARKTALVNVLDHLAIALALCEEDELCEEARMFRTISRVFALGRYGTSLDAYEREQGSDATVPSVDEVIDRLGGVELMLKVRAEKTADERYPAAMQRLRRLMSHIPDDTLEMQMATFLEHAVLSRWDGLEPERARVNLLTLHSTKGLEFSRVYIVGAEDMQMPGSPPPSGEHKVSEIEEARRLLYVGMTRTVDRLVLTRAATRNEKPTGGHRFLDEMGLTLSTSG